jgi:hypothetical protein
LSVRDLIEQHAAAGAQDLNAVFLDQILKMTKR